MTEMQAVEAYCRLRDKNEEGFNAMFSAILENGERVRLVEHSEESDLRLVYEEGIHPCLAPLSGVIDKQYSAHPARFGTLRRVVRGRGAMFRARSGAELCGGVEAFVDLQLRFLIFQILSLLTWVQEHFANELELQISTSTTLLTDRLWIEVLPCFRRLVPHETTLYKYPDQDLPLTTRWLEGRISNFEYLMALNKAAGRGSELGEDHAVLPWVTDFGTKNGGWRDLTKTKFRLIKGDAMLDRSFGALGHHVAEPGISELALCIYLARQTPLCRLKSVVRSNFVPEQYPSTMSRLYQWSPDECIPEFYADASVFKSIHRDIGLPNLSVPSWCTDASDFITYHRSLLESEQVTKHLHNWIDLYFGVAAVDSFFARKHKNVPLLDEEAYLDKLLGFSPSPSALLECQQQREGPPTQPRRRPQSGASSGLSLTETTAASSAAVVQLFDAPHPPRILSVPDTRRQSTAAKQSLVAFLSLEPASSRSVVLPAGQYDTTAKKARSNFERQSNETTFVSTHTAFFEYTLRSPLQPLNNQQQISSKLLPLVKEIYSTSCCRQPRAVQAALEALRKGELSQLASSSRKQRFFPAYFEATLELGSRLHSQQTARGTVETLLASLEILEELSLAGVMLILPQLLRPLDSTQGWTCSAELEAVTEAIGKHLGVRHSAQALAPRLARIVNTLLLTTTPDNNETASNQRLLHAADALWRTVIRRCGPAAFVKQLLPALIESTITTQSFSSEMAAQLVRLAREDALGPALTARFVLSSLCSGLGALQAPRGCRAAAVVSLCRVLGAEAVAPLVLEPVLTALSALEGVLSEPQPTESAWLALLELVSVMHRLVGSGLNEASVLHFYVRAGGSESQRDPLPRLMLALLPSATIKLDDEALRNAALALREVASLVSLVCLQLGDTLTVQHLLPDLDKFFAQLVHLYRSPEAAPAARRLALDLAKELYTPLAAMLSLEVMRKHAPSAKSLVQHCLHQDNDSMAPPPSLTESQYTTSTALPSKQRAIDWGHETLEKGIDWILRLNQATETSSINMTNNEEQLEGDGMELHQLRDARSAQDGLSSKKQMIATRSSFNDDDEDPRRSRRQSIVIEIDDDGGLDDLDLEEEDEPELLTAVSMTEDAVLSDDDAHQDDGEEEEAVLPPQPPPDDNDGEKVEVSAGRRRRNFVSSQKNARRQVSSQFSGSHQSIDEDLMPPTGGEHIGENEPDNAEFGALADDSHQTRAQRHLWLLGGWSATQARPWELVDGPWAPRLCVTSPALQLGDLAPEERAQHEVLSSRRRRGASCALSTDFAESVAMVGGRDGLVRLWSLREPPGRVGPPVCMRTERHARRVRSLFCLDGASSAVSSDGTRFDVFDLVTGKTVRKWVWAVPFGSPSERLVDVTALPLGYGALLPGVSGPQQVAALAERALSLVDVRGTGRSAVTEFLISFALPRGGAIASSVGPPSSSLLNASISRDYIPAEQQGLETEAGIEEPPHTPRVNILSSSSAHPPLIATPPRSHRSIQNTATCRPLQQPMQPPPESSLYRDDVDAAAAARCVVSVGDGRCLALGSESGRVALLDRRAGRVLCVWPAHAPGVVVVKLIACAQNQLLSLGSDRVATLWNLQFAAPGLMPEALASTRLDVRGPLSPHNLQALRFDDATTLLAAASGHKLAVARFADAYVRSPLSEASIAAANARTATSVLAHRRHFVDDRGQRLHRNQLHIEALTFLPLRRAILLGCDDGSVRVAV